MLTVQCLLRQYLGVVSWSLFVVAVCKLTIQIFHIENTIAQVLQHH